MAKLTHVTVVLLGVVGATAACSALVATGCSSSSSPGVGTDSGEDAQDDGGPTSDAKVDAKKEDSGKDGTADDGKAKSDAEVEDGSTADVVVADAVVGDVVAVDAPEDVVHADAAEDAPHDSAVDAPPVTCVTTIGELAAHAPDAGAGTDAGDAGAPAPTLVTGFDTGGSSDVAGWSVQNNGFIGVDGGPAPTVSYSSGVGDTCPGSIAVTVPFTAYGTQQVGLQYNYPTPNVYPLWTNFTKLHFSVWVSFEASDGGAVGAEAGTLDLSSVGTIDSLAQWNNYTNTDDNGQTGPNATNWKFAPNGNWQPVTLLLSDNTQDGGDVVPTGTSNATGNASKIAALLQIPASAPAGGPAAPTTTTLYLDDIWLE